MELCMRIYTYIYTYIYMHIYMQKMGFPCDSAGKESACSAGVRSLGWEDPLENGKATQSSILTWRIPWTIKSMVAETAITERLSLSHKRWTMKCYMVFMRLLFMGAWGKGEKNRAGYGDPGHQFLFIIFHSF